MVAGSGPGACCLAQVGPLQVGGVGGNTSVLVGGVVPPCGSQAHISAVIQGNGAGGEGQVDMYYLKFQEVE